MNPERDVLSLPSRSVMYVFGGFNSQLLSDVLVYTSPSCSAFSSQATCARAWPGALCVWNSTLEACLLWDSSGGGGEGGGADQHPPSALCSTRSCRCRRDGATWFLLSLCIQRVGQRAPGSRNEAFRGRIGKNEASLRPPGTCPVAARFNSSVTLSHTGAGSTYMSSCFVSLPQFPGPFAVYDSGEHRPPAEHCLLFAFSLYKRNASFLFPVQPLSFHTEVPSDGVCAPEYHSGIFSPWEASCWAPEAPEVSRKCEAVRLWCISSPDG